MSQQNKDAGASESGRAARTDGSSYGLVYIASDHAGFELKEKLKQMLAAIRWEDLGPADDSRVDYPDFADLLAHRMTAPGSANEADTAARGILICGSGQGMAIRANRHLKIRAALGCNEELTRLARQHNDANVLCLGARVTTPETACRMVEIFLSTPFEGGRHADRVEKLDRLSEDVTGKK